MKKQQRPITSGEITVQSTHHGRQITLDPLRVKTLQIEAREVESTAACGYRQMWVSGEREGAEFTLTAGAGLGSPYITFDYRNRGYCIDVRDILNALFAFADDDDEE